MSDARRVCMIRCHSSIFAALFGQDNSPRYTVVDGGLPLDATLIGADWDVRRGVMILAFHSMEFESTPEGIPFPEIEPRFRWRTDSPGESQTWCVSTFHPRNSKWRIESE